MVSQLTSRRFPVLRTGNRPYDTRDRLRGSRETQPTKLMPLTDHKSNGGKRVVQNGMQNSAKRAKPLRMHAKTLSQFQRLCPSSFSDVVVTDFHSHGYVGHPGWL